MSRAVAPSATPGSRRAAASAASAQLPLAAPRSRLLCAALVLVSSLAVYAATLAPTVTLVDSGELIVAAQTLGIAHPPGFPLYVLLAHVATLLPIGNVAVRVNFASAVFAALAIAVLSVLGAEILLGIEPPRRGQPHLRPLQTRLSPTPAWPLVWLPVLVPAMLMAFARTLWSYATVAEVYTLNTLLLTLIFFLLLRWQRGVAALHVESSPSKHASRRSLRRRDLLSVSGEELLKKQEATARPEEPPSSGGGSKGARWDLCAKRGVAGPAHRSPNVWLYASAFVFGLALGVHHVTVALTLPAIALLVYATERRVFTSSVLAFATLWALAGLAIYAYLPIAAAQAPSFNWGDPRTLQRFWWHVSGRQFQAYFALSPQSMGAQVALFAKLAAHEFGSPWLPAALALSLTGLYTLFRRDRTMFWCLVLMIVADVLYASTYEIAEDKAAYFLPAFLALALAAGCGARAVIEWASARRWRPAARVAGAALLLVPAATLATNFRVSDHHRDFIAQDYVGNILQTIAPGGMLLTLDWQVYSPLLYVRTVEQRRRDAVVIDLNLLRRSWYLGYLEREYPQLMAHTRAQVDAFLEDLRQWEQDPGLYQRDRRLNERIDTRFTAMIVALVGAHLRAAPVYVTQDVMFNGEVEGGRLRQALTSQYQLVPQGLVFGLFSDRAFHEPPAPHLQTRGLVDGTLEFAPDDVVLLKVLPVYVTMLYNRGRYLAANGRHADAIAAFQEALALNPGFQLAQRALADSRKTLHASDRPPS